MPSLPLGEELRLDIEDSDVSERERLLSSYPDEKGASPTSKPRWSLCPRRREGEEANRTSLWRCLRSILIKSLAMITALSIMATFWSLYDAKHRGYPPHRHHGQWAPLPWRPWHRPHLEPLMCYDIPPRPPTLADVDSLRHSANFSLTLSDPLAAIFTHHTLASSRIEIVRDEPVGAFALRPEAHRGPPPHLPPIPPHRPMVVMINAFHECPEGTDKEHGLTERLLDEMEKDEASIQICSLRVPGEGAGLAVRLHMPEKKKKNKGEHRGDGGEDDKGSADPQELPFKLPPPERPIRLVLRLHAPAGVPLSLSSLLPPPPGEAPAGKHRGHHPHGPGGPHGPGDHGSGGPPQGRPCSRKEAFKAWLASFYSAYL